MANPARVKWLLDASALSRTRVAALTACFLVAVIDGIDFVSIGVVAPLMREDIQMSTAQLGLVLALTQFGAVFGAVVLGRLADRWGRKPLMIGSLLLIALFTWLTAEAQSVAELAPIRFCVGIALTGALPATLAMCAELAPPRLRATVLALVVAGFPLGAAIGSIGGGTLALEYGWRAVFYAGALLPLGLAVLIAAAVPESPVFLAQTDHTGRRVEAALARYASPVDSSGLWRPLAKSERNPGEREPPGSGGAFGALFADGLARPTLMLWAMLFCSGVLSNVTLVWLPTIFDTAGRGVGYAAAVVGVVNIGATLGMATAGRLLELAGARLTVMVAFLVAATATLALGLAPTREAAMAAGGLLGFFLGITTSAGYALSALIYPVSARSTGVGAAAAALRIGTVAAPILIPMVLAVALPLTLTLALVAFVPALAALVAARLRPDFAATPRARSS